MNCGVNSDMTFSKSSIPWSGGLSSPWISLLRSRVDSSAIWNESMNFLQSSKRTKFRNDKLNVSVELTAGFFFRCPGLALLVSFFMLAATRGSD